MSARSVRDFLDRHGLAPSRSLGQNFLVDDEIAARLADRAGVGPGDGVLEIGTGLGILTRALAARAARVVSLEIDAGLVRALESEASLPENVRLVHADATRYDLAAAIDALPAPRRVVANLPYAVTGPLLRRLLDLRGQLADWSVMIQRDVAERLLAAPGTRTYGSLTVLHRICVDVEKAQDLGPRCFYPVPKVHSRFVRLRPHARLPLAPGELEAVERVIRAAFGQRRKTLPNALRGAGFAPAGLEDALEALGLDPRIRAEGLAPEQFLALTRALARGDAG